MCRECRPSLSAARQRACISKTLDMFLKVTDKTDKSPFHRHGFSSEHASDVLTKPTEGPRWFLPGEVACRGPREQPGTRTDFLAPLPTAGKRPPNAPRWAVGQRTPPGRTDLRLGRPVGPRRRFCAFGATGRGLVAPPPARDASRRNGRNGKHGSET